MTGGELHLRVAPRMGAATRLRHALAAYLVALDIDEEQAEAIVTAVGEALANAVEHAYDGSEPGDIELNAAADADGVLHVDVDDRGRFIEREAREGRGFGMRIVRAIARDVRVETENGTRVRMLFDAARSHGGVA